MDILFSKLSNLVGLSTDKIIELYPKIAQQIVVYKINETVQLIFLLFGIGMAFYLFFFCMSTDLFRDWDENPIFKKKVKKIVRIIAVTVFVSVVSSITTLLLTPDLQILNLILK